MGGDAQTVNRLYGTKFPHVYTQKPSPDFRRESLREYPASRFPAHPQGSPVRGCKPGRIATLTGWYSGE